MIEKNVSQMIKMAQMGDSEASMELVDLVMPLIAKYSVIEGKTDPDLRQYLILRVLNATQDFRI